MNINTLLKSPESKTLEFKANLKSPDGIIKTLTAFANTAGGTLLIGIEDKERNICGVDNPLQEEEKIANLISDNIHPKLVPNIEIIPWRQTYLIAIQVYPSNIPPHYFKKKGKDQGVFIRIGSTNRVADITMVNQLERLILSKTFDEEAMLDLNSEVIDFRAASELFSQYKALKKQDLKSLKLVIKQQSKLVPTVGGVLLFGKNRTEIFPDAWIQVGRFRGNNRSHIIDTRRIDNYLPSTIEEVITFINKHTTVAYKIGELRRDEIPSIPPVAIREAVINAVVHADYSQRGSPIRVGIFDDRIEIENPGLIPFGMTLDDMYRGISKLRNPVIARVFNELKLAEQWGSGIKRMISSCQDAGLQDPKLEEISTHFRVTIFLTKVRQATISSQDQEVISALQQCNDGLSTKEIAEKINLSTRATRTRLLGMIEKGIVVDIGSNPKDPNRKYYLVEG